jgi:hypothetical protein
LPESREHEVKFWDTELLVSSWKEKVNRLWVIPIVVIVSYWTELFEWDVSADGRATKSTISVLRASNLVTRPRFNAFSEIFVWL